MDLLILQNGDELKTAEKVLGDTFRRTDKIAWTPFAINSLRKGDISYETIADYATEKNDSHQLTSQLVQFREWCDIVDKHIASSIPEVASSGIRPFMNKLLALRIDFFLYFSEIDKLNVLLKKTGAMNVYYFHYPKPRPSLISRLLDVIEKDNKWGVNFKRLVPESNYRSFFPAAGLVPDWFDRRNGLWYKAARFMLRRSANRNIPSFIEGVTGHHVLNREKRNILVLSVDWDVSEILSKLKQRVNCNFIYWDDVLVKHPRGNVPVEQIMERIKNDPDAHTWTSRCGMDLFDLFVPEIEKTLRDDVPLLISIVRRFRELNNRFNFCMLISSYQLTQWEAIFDQAEALDIPVTLFLHGGAIGPLEGYPPIQLCSRGGREPSKLYHLVYSEAISNYCDSFRTDFSNYTARNIPVGSYYYEKLLERNNGKRRTEGNHIKIYYVCGGVGIHNCTFNRGIYDDASLYELRYRVIDKFRNMPDSTLYYKMGYNTEHCGIELEQEILGGVFENVVAVPSDTNLVDILAEADLFIMESPSTTLFEILTTSKPAVLLIEPRALELTEPACALLKDRVTIVGSATELADCIDDIAKNGLQAKAFVRPDHSDKAFINTFATHGGHNSMERTLDFFESVIGQKDCDMPALSKLYN